MRRTKVTALLIIFAIITALATGCFSNNNSPSEVPKPDSSDSAAAKESTEPASTGSRKMIGGGGKITMLYPSPETLDWRFGGWAVIYAKQLYAEGLTRLDANYKAIPALATEWSPSNGDKTWTFKIREDAKWSNGERLVAGDIVWAWQHTIDPKVWGKKSNTPWYGTNEVEIVNQKDIMGEKKTPSELGISAPDDKTFVVNLVRPVADFPAQAALLWGLVLHKSVGTDPEGAFSLEKIVVNGPYKPKEFKLNEKTVWVPNEHYYGDVTLDEITLKIADSHTNMAAYMNNELDIMQIGAPELAAVENNPTLSKELIKDAAAGYKVLTYLNNSPNTILENPNIGMALNIAIDKKLLAETVSKGTVEPTNSLITPFIDPNWPNQLPFNVEKAKQLLADAGFPDGNGLPTIQISVSHGAVVDPFILGVKEQWEKNLGVKVNVDNIGDWGVWWQKFNSPMDADYVGYFDDAYTPPYASPLPLVSNAFDYYRKSFSGAKYKEYHELVNNKDLNGEERNKKLDDFYAANATENAKKFKQLVDGIKDEPDAIKKLELAKQADKLRLESGLYIPLYSWKSMFLVKSTVKGYSPDKFFFGKPQYFNGITNKK